MTATHTPRGIVLLAHGARDPLWARPFEAVLVHLRTLSPDTPIELAFLEFMTPGLREAGARLAGCGEVVVVPLFLGAGGHVRKDIPALVAQLEAAHPTTTFRLSTAVGEHPTLVAALATVALDLTRTS